MTDACIISVCVVVHVRVTAFLKLLSANYRLK